jgi:hypothetical protein
MHESNTVLISTRNPITFTVQKTLSDQLVVSYRDLEGHQVLPGTDGILFNHTGYLCKELPFGRTTRSFYAEIQGVDQEAGQPFVVLNVKNETLESLTVVRRFSTVSIRNEHGKMQVSSIQVESTEQRPLLANDPLYQIKLRPVTSDSMIVDLPSKGSWSYLLVPGRLVRVTYAHGLLPAPKDDVVGYYIVPLALGD